MMPPDYPVTKEGYDLQFGTNVIGPWYFTELLMPALLAGVQTSPDHHARVVTTSSSGAYLGTIDFDTFKDTPKRRKLNAGDLYAQSKLVRSHVSLLWCPAELVGFQADVIIARQIAKRYADKGIVSLSLNPGMPSFFLDFPRVVLNGRLNRQHPLRPSAPSA